MVNPPTSAPSARVTNTLAIVALTAGIASWIGFPLVAAAVAIFCGHKARSEIRTRGGAESGDELAVIGLVLGYGNVILSCVGGAIALVIFSGAIAAAIGLGGLPHGSGY